MSGFEKRMRGIGLQCYTIDSYKRDLGE